MIWIKRLAALLAFAAPTWGGAQGFPAKPVTLVCPWPPGLAMEDPEHVKTLQQLDQLYWYKLSSDDAQWAAESFKAERATIERVGLLAK